MQPDNGILETKIKVFARPARQAQHHIDINKLTRIAPELEGGMHMVQLLSQLQQAGRQR